MAEGGKLQGRVALVTGAGRRLGRAFADGLVREGAGLVACYQHSAEGAHEVMWEARRRGAKAVALQADLSKPEEAAGLVDRAREEIGTVDVLVNSAAIFEPLGPLETTLEAWDRHIAINLTAPILLCQAFARQELDQGAIVNIVDWRALRPGADHFPYSISKAGLAAATRSLALALAPRIRVNALALGAILPPADGGEGNPIERVPAGRWAELDEVVEALVFMLAGPGYVTGEVLHVDGGRHLT